MVIAADYPFLDVFWTMLIFFVWVIWIWIVITVFVDVFRRHDIGGFAKAAWVDLRDHPAVPRRAHLPDRRARRDARAQHEAGPGPEGRRSTSTCATRRAAPPTEIAKAKELLDAGAITQAEFDAIKAKALS